MMRQCGTSRSSIADSAAGAVRAGYRGLASLIAFGLLLQPAFSAEAAGPETEVLLETSAPGPDGIPAHFDDDGRGSEREEMVANQVAARGVSDERLLSVMRRVPRHEFVPRQSRHRAYDDTPLAIGHGQTISQPYIVGFMTETLELEPGDRVLEIGTGSAYQAAILAELVHEVVSIEIIEALAQSAAARLEHLGYRNITVVHGDGYYGFEAAAPFDAIIVTAAASHVPPPLVSQLKAGGRIAIPVGRAWTQNLLLVEKNEQGETSTRNLMAVRFVPLTGEH
jgi:protein-L-isoaspartate(D-aspartate) O-methyltransferase